MSDLGRGLEPAGQTEPPFTHVGKTAADYRAEAQGHRESIPALGTGRAAASVIAALEKHADFLDGWAERLETADRGEEW